MAYDPDWDDDPVPTLNELYRTGEIIEFTPETKSKVLKPLIDFITFIIRDVEFQEEVFDLNVLSSVSNKNYNKILNLMRVCAIELLEKMLNIQLKGKISKDSMWNIAGACLTLAIKLYGAHDWIWARNIMPAIVTVSEKWPDLDESLNPRILNLMERDIMKRTDWKGCATFYLNRKYDLMFPELDNELTDFDYRQMLNRGSSLLKEGIGNVELNQNNYGFVLMYNYLDYNNRQVDELPFREMNVVVTHHFVESVAENKKITKDEAFNWLRDRVLKVGFGIDPLSFKYKKRGFNFGKTSRKTSRKALRKSRS